MSTMITNRKVTRVLDTIIAEDMKYIEKVGSCYTAHIHTPHSVTPDMDGDTRHDHVMQELDHILNYFYAKWDREQYGPYEQYAEVIRDFVIENVFVKFH
jgi:hypothetical protein